MDRRGYPGSVFDEAVHQCLQSEHKSYDQICDYFRANYGQYLHAEWESDIGNSIKNNPAIKQDQRTKSFYLTTDAFVTISLTREQLEQLRGGESKLVLLPSQDHRN